MKGKLIVISGMDGCGKGTQIELLKKYLIKKGYNVEITKAYDELEKELFSAYIEYASQIEIMFLFQAFHTKQRIETERYLSEGKIVLADRWDETYFGYHNNHGILSEDEGLKNRLNEIAYNNLRPDIAFMLDVDPTIAMERCRVRGADFFDRKSIEHHSKLSGEYLKIARENSEWEIIAGQKNILTVHKEILKHIEVLFD